MNKLLETKQGFTLIEICLVLLLLVLFLGLAIPNVRSAWVEEQVCEDASRLESLVKRTMELSRTTKQRLTLTLSGSKASVQPILAGRGGAGPILFSLQLHPTDRLEVVRSEETTAGDEFWSFGPNELCPMPRVRISQGRSWLEVDFNALTGSRENEASSFP